MQNAAARTLPMQARTAPRAAALTLTLPPGCAKFAISQTKEAPA